MTQVMMRALEEAARLHHGSAGSLHVLLALLADGPTSVAKLVLTSLGLDRDRINRVVAALYDQTDDNGTSVVVTTEPLWHEILGFSEGLAAAEGNEHATQEQVLLALLWHRQTRLLDEVLHSAGTSRYDVAAALSAEGVAVPRAILPALAEPMSQAAEFSSDRAPDVIAALHKNAKSSWWGIAGSPANHTMTVLATKDVDLAAILGTLLDEEDWHWVSAPSAPRR